MGSDDGQRNAGSGSPPSGSGRLVLALKPGESIMVGDDVEITLSQIMPNKVRLAITAPRDVPVDRKSVYLDKRATREASPDADPVDPRQ